MNCVFVEERGERDSHVYKVSVFHDVISQENSAGFNGESDIILLTRPKSMDTGQPPICTS